MVGGLKVLGVAVVVMDGRVVDGVGSGGGGGC